MSDGAAGVTSIGDCSTKTDELAGVDELDDQSSPQSLEGLFQAFIAGAATEKYGQRLITDLRDDTCKWPGWGDVTPRPESAYYCGERCVEVVDRFTKQTRSYCAFHANKARQ